MSRISHLSLVIGHLSLVICHWSLVIGHLSLVLNDSCRLVPSEVEVVEPKLVVGAISVFDTLLGSQRSIGHLQMTNDK
ncbi:MAG: hypothetical protein RM368_05425 [Nostoc sp. DedSLP03]|uniref:hypothetical protein n=1 Tax=Nostoc sp. DedSLP03 TaxID=3075400 RepID=UPI002AD2F33A|nr:hypothetical protein [Nostoc sp. DedSLP03]MDZ7964400.1 hypothetical protein [Nostoc sp. DedSLP03]